MTGSTRFRLVVFTGNGTEPTAVHESELDNWAQFERLRMPGFDDSYSLSLSHLWTEFFEKGQAPVEQTLTGYETIVKFGDTMQLKQAFRVTIELETNRC